MGEMLLPPFLLVGPDDDQVRAVTALLTRIGLANPVRVSATFAAARDYLQTCATSRLPVIVLTCEAGPGGSGIALIEWMRQQPDAIAGLDVIALVSADEPEGRERAEALGVPIVPTPVEMRALIAAMKGLALPETAKIDPATLTVRVELWPRGSGVSRQ